MHDERRGVPHPDRVPGIATGTHARRQPRNRGEACCRIRGALMPYDDWANAIRGRANGTSRPTLNSADHGALFPFIVTTKLMPDGVKYSFLFIGPGNNLSDIGATYDPA